MASLPALARRVRVLYEFGSGGSERVAGRELGGDGCVDTGGVRRSGSPEEALFVGPVGCRLDPDRAREDRPAEGEGSSRIAIVSGIKTSVKGKAITARAIEKRSKSPPRDCESPQTSIWRQGGRRTRNARTFHS